MSNAVNGILPRTARIRPEYVVDPRHVGRRSEDRLLDDIGKVRRPILVDLVQEQDTTRVQGEPRAHVVTTERRVRRPGHLVISLEECWDENIDQVVSCDKK